MDEERLTQMCLTLWPMLTEDEKEAYYVGLGTISFVENVAALLAFYDAGKLVLPDAEVIDSILDKIEAMEWPDDCE